MSDDRGDWMTPEQEAWLNEVAGRVPVMREMIAAYAEEGPASIARYRLSHPEEFDAMMVALLDRIPPPGR